MRNASPALIALINSGTQFYVADCLTIVRADGTAYRFTTAPVDVTTVSQYDSASHVFSAGGVTFRRGRTALSVGLEVDDLELTLLTDPVRDLVTIGGVLRTWPDIATAGLLDEATVMIERAFMATWGDTSAGTLVLFAGRMGEIRTDRTNVDAMIKADLALLALPMPRNVYGPGCLHTLYDSGCGLSKAAFLLNGTVQPGSTQSVIVTGLPGADGYYELGALTITNGAMTGLVRTVKKYAGGAATLNKPLPASPIGAAFSIYPGCDKVQSTCSNKFANLARFRGFPYIPTPENAR